MSDFSRESAALESLNKEDSPSDRRYTMDEMRDYALGVMATRRTSVSMQIIRAIEAYREIQAAAELSGNVDAAALYELFGRELYSLHSSLKMLGTSSLQKRSYDWCVQCFGPELANDKRERVHRFGEEALEAMQAGGMTKEEAQAALDYVYGRPIGQMRQEIQGVMTTLGSMCQAFGIDMVEEGERDLIEISDPERMRAIGEKRKRKPEFRAPILTEP